MPTNALKRLIEWPGKAYKRRLIEREFASRLSLDARQREHYRRELVELGLLDQLHRKEQAFRERVAGKSQRGNPYHFGSIKVDEAVKLYALIREARPEVVVETGVCNGFSSAFTLLALAQNGRGRLHSIDLPEVAGEVYEAGAFWEGKQGAVIPQGERPGWIIPDELRGNWELLLGKSQDHLPALLERLGTIDVFMHDSEHSYECMWFEFTTAYPALRPGGLLVADDTTWNRAFQDFAASQSRDVIRVSMKMACLIK